MKILFIEDDREIQRSTVRMLRLKDATIEVLLAQSHDEAVEHLTAHDDLHLVLSDFNLIGPKTGGDILDWIKANRPELVERFVFISGNDEVKKLHDRWITKPCFAEDIRALLR